MKAPDKIYLAQNILGDVIEGSWQFHKLREDNIEYTRTDAFIEKLECWMNENFHFHAGEFAEGILAQFDRTEDAIDDFRKYINGE